MDVDCVVVGAGFAGLGLLHRLRELGLTACAFEAGADVGGTWYWNRYPGARVDIPSVDYMFSFDPDWRSDWQWSEKYATQPEILRRIDAALDEARRGGADLAFVDGAVIVGTPFEARCDALILVTAPYETSVARICARDGIAPEMARRRLDAQTPLETLRAAATAELVNDSTPDALREKLRSVLNGLEKEGTCQKPKSEKEAF